MQCALSHCQNNWYDNRNFLLFEKKQGEKNGSLAQCMGESLMLAGSTWLPEWCRCSSAASSRSVLAEPSEIEAPEGEDSTRLPNGFSRRYMRYTATSPGRGRCPRRWAAGRRQLRSLSPPFTGESVLAVRRWEVRPTPATAPTPTPTPTPAPTPAQPRPGGVRDQTSRFWEQQQASV